MKKLLVALFCVSLVAVVEAAKIKVQAAPDPAFDFATVHTWAWDEDAGQVIMARTQTDDPAPVKARIDPSIRKYVEAAMVRKGLKVATGGTPDVYIVRTYEEESEVSGHHIDIVSLPQPKCVVSQ